MRRREPRAQATERHSRFEFNAGVAAACARASVQPLRVRPLIAAHGAEGAGAAAATAEASGAAHTGGFGARGYGARALEPVFGLHAAQMMTMNE